MSGLTIHDSSISSIKIITRCLDTFSLFEDDHDTCTHLVEFTLNNGDIVQSLFTQKKIQRFIRIMNSNRILIEYPDVSKEHFSNKFEETLEKTKELTKEYLQKGEYLFVNNCNTLDVNKIKEEGREKIESYTDYKKETLALFEKITNSKIFEDNPCYAVMLALGERGPHGSCTSDGALNVLLDRVKNVLLANVKNPEFLRGYAHYYNQEIMKKNEIDLELEWLYAPKRFKDENLVEAFEYGVRELTEKNEPRFFRLACTKFLRFIRTGVFETIRSVKIND